MKTSATPNGRIILGYLGLAHSDYLVARHLLRSGFLEHGAMMAATAVEKHLKAVIGVHGLSRSEHLGSSLYNLVRNCQPALYNALDFDFIKFLAKAYKLRYATVSAPGLAIVINQYRTLFALDATIAKVDIGFKIIENGKTLPTPFQQCVVSNNLQLLDDNIALRSELLRELTQRSNKVLELRIENDYSGLRVEYETEGVNMSGLFTKIPDLSTKKTEFQLTRG